MKRTLVSIFLILGFFSTGNKVQALHPFYEQNGDCYMLVGDGPYRGVYALNNLTTGVSQKLYDPFDAYGITAAQRWDGSDSQKTLFTFASAAGESGWTAVTGMISRPCIVQADSGVYTTAVPYIVHRYHGAPNASPTGRGNHAVTTQCTTCGPLNRIFGGTCYPCSVIPAATPGRPGYYQVPVGAWYHSLDYPFFSPYTYRSFGGWVHWVVRERVEAKFRNLELYNYSVNTRPPAPSKLSDVASVKTGERSFLDKRGECVDGCMSAADNIVLPGQSNPYLDTAYSSLGISYLYNRMPDSSVYTLVGMTPGGTLIGDPAHNTTKFVGVSSKSAEGDWVYVLGTELINAWLIAANAPFRITDLTDVAVSDQWWQSGGIVYAYDKSQKKVYKFVRKETTAEVAIPEQINVYDGTSLPDSISTDGFGNLYMVKTEKEPADSSTFTPTDAVRYENTWSNQYRAYFTQGVYKSVFKRDYYSKAVTRIPGRVAIGTNNFYRDFSSNTPADPTTWRWIDPLYQIGADVQTTYRSEIAVINNATPPKVTGSTVGKVDCNGPLVNSDSGLVPVTGECVDTDTYYFQVENFPIFDTNEVNVGAEGTDRDGDLWKGGFPTTVKKSTVKYYWKVIQTKDRYGVDVTNTILDQEAAGTPTTSPILPVTLPGGEYKVYVKAKFAYYDYDRLPLGSLADAKETVLTPAAPALLSATSPDGTGYAWETIRVKTVPLVSFPGGRGVIMSGKPSGSSYDYRPMRPTDAALVVPPNDYCSYTNDQPPGPKYVIQDKLTNWSFKLRESDYNTSRSINRITTMLLASPPNPNDNRMVTGTLQWMGSPKFTWTAILKRGTEGIVDRSITKEVDNVEGADFKGLFPVPSQPRAYLLTVRGTRTYQYDTFKPITTVIGTELVTTWVQMTVPVNIQIAADCQVVVTDEDGPKVEFDDPFVTGGKVKGVFANCPVMYGTTGDTLADVDSPPVANPASLTYIVADNNPMGNDSASDDLPALSYSDPFFGTPVTHNVSWRYGRLYYTNGAGETIPTPGDTGSVGKYYSSNSDQSSAPNATYRVRQKNLVGTDFGTGELAWIPGSDYNKAFSYRLYEIGVADLKHFKDQSGTYQTEMALNYANNVPGYSNLIYGLEWMDARGMKLNIDQGVIVIRDNKRPNVFIKANEQKNPNVWYYCPSNIKPSIVDGSWIRLATGITSEAKWNGIQAWRGTDIGGFDIGIPAAVGVKVTENLVGGEAQIETDIPVFFTTKTSDNTGSIATYSFQFFEGSNNITNQINPGTDIVAGSFRYMFRKPGDYSLKIVIDDKALGWPANINTPTAASDKRNRRELDCKFKVYATRLDVRVIDRTINNR